MKKLTYYIDILFCIVILPALIMLLPIDRWLADRTLFAVLLIGWLYTIYFVNRVFVIPSLFKGTWRRYLAIFALFVGLVIAYVFAMFEGTPNPHRFIERIGVEDVKIQERIVNEWDNNRPEQHRARNNSRLQQQAIWFLYFLTSSFAVSVSLLTQLYRHRALNQEVVYEKKRAELALYKAQINPHFLFNTLNTLYGLVVTKSDRAEEAFILFTNLMKYIYTNGSANKVEVCDEVEYIGQYIELQTLRLSELTTVNYRCSASASSCKSTITPMLLITFIENIFKHGVSPHTPSTLNIDIDIVDDELILNTDNPIVTRQSTKEKSGIGIANCRNRLELLYPNKYELHIRQKSDNYKLSLKLSLA